MDKTADRQMTGKKRVFVNVETVSRFGRDIFEGIRQFASKSGWEIHFEPRPLTERLPDWFGGGTWDGIISRSGDRSIVEESLRKNSPHVELNGTGPEDGPEVSVDPEGVARMVFRHFYERGFRRFAVFSFGESRWSRLETDLYQKVLEEEGFDGLLFHLRNRCDPISKWTEADRNRLRAWLLELPKPTALYVVSDVQALPVYQTCRDLGLRIPNDVAVVCVENDEWLCNAVDPPMSGVDRNGKKIGYLAAELLRDRMEGRRLEPQRIRVAPLMIRMRQSSDCVKIDDSDLVDTVRYIHETACSGLTVDEVVEYSAFSHSTLGRLFKKWLGRTIEEEIRRVRIEQAKRLLQETKISMAAVAKMSGFRSHGYFCHTFHELTGMSPSEFRGFA